MFPGRTLAASEGPKRIVMFNQTSRTRKEKHKRKVPLQCSIMQQTGLYRKRTSAGHVGETQLDAALLMASLAEKPCGHEHQKRPSNCPHRYVVLGVARKDEAELGAGRHSEWWVACQKCEQNGLFRYVPVIAAMQVPRQQAWHTAQSGSYGSSHSFKYH